MIGTSVVSVPARDEEPQSLIGRSSPLALPAAAGCALAGVAALAAMDVGGTWLLAPVALAVLLALPLLVVRPVAVVVVAAVMELASPRSFDDGAGIPGVYVLTLGLACLAAVIAVLRRQLRPAWSPVLFAGLLLLAVQAVAALAGRMPSHSLAVVEETAKEFLWLAVLLTLLLASASAPRSLARTIVVTLAALAALTAAQEFVLGNANTFGGLAAVPLEGDLGAATARHAGPQLDVNFWGRVLVLGLPFALSLAQMAGSRPRMLAWLAAAASIFGGIVLTGSRGGLLAAFAVVGAWALLAGGRYARSLWFAPVGLGLLLAVPGIGSRLSTLSMFGGDSALDLADPSLEGRAAAQDVAIEMLVDHPVLGIGPGNFLGVEPEYLRRLSLTAEPLAPHNLYLEAAAESGLLGLAAWMFLFGTAAVVAWRARVLIRQGPVVVGETVALPLVNGTIAALLGWAVSSVFLHVANFRTLLLVVAMAAALDIWARRTAAAAPPDAPVAAPPPRGHGRSGSARRRLLAAGVLFVLAVATWQLGGGSGELRSWSATAGLQLVVRSSEADITAYEQDALTRTAVIRTFAGITADRRFLEEGRSRLGPDSDDLARYAVDIDNTAPSGFIAVVARGPQRETAVALAESIRSEAGAFINSLDQLYTVEEVAGPATVSGASPPLDRRWALVPLVGAIGLAVSLLGRRPWRIGGRRRR